LARRNIKGQQRANGIQLSRLYGEDPLTELAILLAGASLGIIVFQSAVLAPLVFSQLKDGSSGPFLRALFPRFFLILAGLSLSTALSSYFGDFSRGVILGCIALALALVAYVLIPSTNRARDEGRTTTFKCLHLASVLLTLGIGITNLLTVFS
jgi:hypothetical protein